MRRIVLLALLAVVGCTPAAVGSLVASLSVTSNVPSTGVFPGDSFTLSVVPLDGNGDIIVSGIVPVSYTSSDTTVATISSGGLVTAVSAGTTSLRASAGGRVATLTLTVDGNTTGSVVVTPATPSVAAASQVQLTAAVITTLGNPARNKTVTWSTSDATKATVDGTGNVTGVAAGTASVCATATDATSIKGCQTVTVH